MANIFLCCTSLTSQYFFFPCSEIHSPSLEMWALYRKSLACTSTNGWVLFPVCSSWCCKGIAKNYWLRHKSKKWMDMNVASFTCTFTNTQTRTWSCLHLQEETPQRDLLIHSLTSRPHPCLVPALGSGGEEERRLDQWMGSEGLGKIPSRPPWSLCHDAGNNTLKDLSMMSFEK